MKITAIEPITCDSGIGGRDWLFVKVTTDEGIVGWGEGYDWHAGSVLAEAIRVLGQELIGEDPRRIDLIGRRFWDVGKAGVPERMKVLAAIEIALYDIKGKWLGVPVYELLGGLYRDRLPLYWSHFASYRAIDPEALGVEPARTMDSWIALVDDVEAAGFKALKTNLLVPGPDDRPAADAVRRDRPLPDRRRGGVHRRPARAGRAGHGDPVRRRPGVPPWRDHRARAGARAVRPVLAGGGRVRRRRAADRPTRHADPAVPRRGAHPPRGSSGRSSSGTSPTW